MHPLKYILERKLKSCPFKQIIFYLCAVCANAGFPWISMDFQTTKFFSPKMQGLHTDSMNKNTTKRKLLLCSFSPGTHVQGARCIFLLKKSKQRFRAHDLSCPCVVIYSLLADGLTGTVHFKIFTSLGD